MISSPEKPERVTSHVAQLLSVVDGTSMDRPYALELAAQIVSLVRSSTDPILLQQTKKEALLWICTSGSADQQLRGRPLLGLPQVVIYRYALPEVAQSMVQKARTVLAAHPGQQVSLFCQEVDGKCCLVLMATKMSTAVAEQLNKLLSPRSRDDLAVSNRTLLKLLQQHKRRFQLD